MAIPAFYFSEEWKKLREKTLERDRYICQYCGDKAAQADHIYPRGAGGRDHPDNLVACCVSCNHIAGGRVFKNFKHKKEYILKVKKDRRKKRNRWWRMFD